MLEKVTQKNKISPKFAPFRWFGTASYQIGLSLLPDKLYLVYSNSRPEPFWWHRVSAAFFLCFNQSWVLSPEGPPTRQVLR
mgnify:FL=1